MDSPARAPARSRSDPRPPVADPPLAQASDLERLFGLRPPAWLRRMPGRETFLWPGQGRWVVKRFRGDEARDWWYERVRGAAPRSPGRREAENLEALFAAGLPVPRPLGWAEEPRSRRHPRLGGRGARSALVMERVDHERDLRRLLAERPGEASGWLVPLAELVARLHRAGWYHRDLYLQHLAVRPGDGPRAERLVLLDVGRARRETGRGRPRRRWFVKDLAALHLSTPRAVPPALRRRFLAAWLRATGFPGPAAAWERDVLDKARRLAAHAPRHADPDGPGEDPL